MRIHALTTKDRFLFVFPLLPKYVIETYKVGVEKILTFQGLKRRDVVEGHFNMIVIFLHGFSGKLTNNIHNIVMEVMQLFQFYIEPSKQLDIIIPLNSAKYSLLS